MTTVMKPSTWPRWARGVASFVALFAFGAAVGAGVAGLFPDLPEAMGFADVRAADIAASVIALVMIVSGSVTAFASFNQRMSRALLKLEGPVSDDERGYLRLQALIVAFSGVIMVMPMILSGTVFDGVVGLGVVLALLAAHTVLNVHLYRRCDEMLREVVRQSAVITFWLGQGVLFIWAAAERMALAPSISAWDAYVALMALYLVVAAGVTWRRGLA